MKKLYRLEYEDQIGLFIQEEKNFLDRIGQEIHYGDYGNCYEINIENIKEIPAEEEFIKKFEELGLEIGIDPIDMLICNEKHEREMEEWRKKTK